MTKDAKDFLTALLWCHDEEKRYDADDFSPEFVEAVQVFIDGFRDFLNDRMYDMSRLEYLTGSFGSNVFLSLSGNGSGFFDEWGDPEKTLGDELQLMLNQYAGESKFEHLDIDYDEKPLDLNILSEFIDDRRKQLFAVRDWKSERRGLKELWKQEVGNDNTVKGYWEWTANKLKL